MNGRKGPVAITPDNPLYDGARQEWNRRIQKFPGVLAYCGDVKDVSRTIKWARERCTDIRIRSGGHNYEGYSVGNGVMVVDVSPMAKVDVDPKHNRVAIGGGAKNQDVYRALAKSGRPFPGGTCPTVGVSGYALGGGWGLSCRLMGLGCDNLEGLELVDAGGRMLRADYRHNPDLFWACRGAGGGNFGVVTSMTFRLPPFMGNVTYPTLSYPVADTGMMAEFIAVWQGLLRNLDVRMTLQATLYYSEGDGRGIFLRGLFYGPPAEARAILRPLMELGNPESDFQYIPFPEAVEQIGSVYPRSEMFKSTGRFVTEELEPLKILETVDILNRPPEGSVFASLGLYSLGGAVSEVASKDTAFNYRDARYILGFQSVWEDPVFAEGNIRWVEKNFPIIRNATAGSYVNFPYSGLRDYQTAYYGDNAVALSEIKAKYDPECIFGFPQSINPANYLDCCNDL